MHLQHESLSLTNKGNGIACNGGGDPNNLPHSIALLLEQAVSERRSPTQKIDASASGILFQSSREKVRQRTEDEKRPVSDRGWRGIALWWHIRWYQAVANGKTLGDRMTERCLCSLIQILRHEVTEPSPAFCGVEVEDPHPTRALRMGVRILGKRFCAKVHWMRKHNNYLVLHLESAKLMRSYKRLMRLLTELTVAKDVRHNAAKQLLPNTHANPRLKHKLEPAPT
ncbi:hypothetical protein BD410DRAFT_810736 [Rickenella mellea]|uniref:Uncharacterized protein n=1 Tax=Rickenella mellea TaxID=50990 RepID=A0A4Y7PE10_9AGAM|nr:hypothetical protein BD410DRAFT_810736 [Rickenella mellea]